MDALKATKSSLGDMAVMPSAAKERDSQVII
jgi:hypothetical protein